MRWIVLLLVVPNGAALKCVNRVPSQSILLLGRLQVRSRGVKPSSQQMQRAAVVLATPVVATVSPVASPVDSASVRRPKHLVRRPKMPIMHAT